MRGAFLIGFLAVGQPDWLDAPAGSAYNNEDEMRVSRRRAGLLPRPRRSLQRLDWEVFSMKKNNNDFPLRSAAKEMKMSFTLTAVVDLVLGCIMLFAPAHVTQLLCMLVGAGVTIYGLFNVLSFIFSRGTVAYSFELLIGICATAFGVFSLVNPDFLSKFLFIVLGLLIMVSSICGVKRAFTLKSYGFERWFLMLISAVVTLVLAITIVIYPALYGDMLMMAIGIVMIVEAVSDLLGIHRLSKFVKDNVTITYGE